MNSPGLRHVMSAVVYRISSVSVLAPRWRTYRQGTELSAVPEDSIFIVHDGRSRPDRLQARALAAGLRRSRQAMACGPIHAPGRPPRVVAAGYELGHDGSAPRRIPLLAGEALRRGWARAVTTATRPSGDMLAVRAGALSKMVEATDGSPDSVLAELRTRGPWVVVWAAARPGEVNEGHDRLSDVLGRRDEGRGERHRVEPPGPSSPGTPHLPPAAVWVGERRWRRLPGLDTHGIEATVSIRHAATDWSVAERWGDHHFASSLSDAFASKGIGARVVPRHAWDHPFAARELVVTLRGLAPARPVTGCVNVLWVISHPADLQAAELAGYDLVAVASAADRERIAVMASSPVVTLHQATDWAQYREPVTGDGSVVFVGNSRGVRRRAVDWALDQGISLEVYGQGWEELYGDELARFGPIDRTEAAKRFNAASVVLGDHWDDMRELGYVSNRVFDVAAAGGLLITDRVVGIEELVPGVVTYDSMTELGEKVREWLQADPAARRSHIERLQALVRENHTFDRRVETILDGLRENVADGSALVESLVRS